MNHKVIRVIIKILEIFICIVTPIAILILNTNGDISKFVIVIISTLFVTAISLCDYMDTIRKKRKALATSYSTVYEQYLLNKLGMQKDVITEQDTELIRSLSKSEKNKKASLKKPEDINKDKKVQGLDEADIIALMLNNHNEITDYFSISKHQAKSSYWFSVCSCIAGIVMLFLSICFIIFDKSLNYAILGLVGAAVTEVLSGTVLWIHNKSALQLNHYYDALHENEKFLSAITIADKLPSETRIEILCEIIRSQLVHLEEDVHILHEK